MSKKEKKDKKPKRTERRFVPRSSTNPWIVRGLAGVASALLGAGLYGYFYAGTFAKDVVDTFYESQHVQQLPAYMIAVGAIVMAAAIWLGTSSEAPVRVGDPGISIEKGEVLRMPWWGVKSISFESGALVLVVAGRLESGTDVVWRIPLKAHPDAIGWIVKEADDRIPKKLEMSDAVFEKLPPAGEHAGMKLALEPLQVVGKKCAATGKAISYEPDARVCTRCERVYFKRDVPKKCKCGADLSALRAANTKNAKARDEEKAEEKQDEDAKEETRETAES